MKKVVQFFALAIAALATTACSLSLNSGINAAGTPAEEATVPTTVIDVANAVVMILPYTLDHAMTGGTGFLVKSKTRGPVILTNRHVCEVMNPDNVIYYIEQPPIRYAGRRIKKSANTDLCAIQVPEEFLRSRKPLRLATRPLQIGQHVNVYGHPFLNPLTYSEGHYINTTREPLNFKDGTLSADTIMQMGRVDFMVQPGNSGSPLLNDANEVVGIIFAMEGGNHMGLFIPLDEIQQFLETLE
jgi:serine protease Do